MTITTDMFVKAHKPVNTPGVCDNKGSCLKLVEYLSKEGFEGKPYYDDFFSHEEDLVPSHIVLKKIDSNHKKLKKSDDKFYMLSINPSQDECRHLVRQVTGKEITEFEQLTAREQEKVITELKVYARDCMDRYARNFRREKVKSGKDLVYFGRVETERHYKNNDKEVREGKVRDGDRKPGLQLHVHIIVSRNDITQTVSLCPLANSRGSVNILNGKKGMIGFDRMEWKAGCFDGFIKRYNYKPLYLYGKNREWQYILGRNEAVSMMKTLILQNEFRTERRMLDLAFRAYRFVVNPQQAFLAELKQNLRHVFTGKENNR